MSPVDLPREKFVMACLVCQGFTSRHNSEKAVLRVGERIAEDGSVLNSAAQILHPPVDWFHLGQP